MFFSYLNHLHACKTKQQERANYIQSLPQVFHEPITLHDKQTLDQPISVIASSVQSGKADPLDILTSYSKYALRAHEETNCLTEVIISSALKWAKDCRKEGPLAGVPVSLKDTIGVAGWDSSIGYSAWVGKPLSQDSTLVELLRDAGAVPFVKTNIPITLLSFESNSDLFGPAKNPHGKDYTPGGSSGGEAALLAFGGSRIGVGSDVAGSVRVPAHYSGVYTIKSSTGRFLKVGGATSIPGQEGVAPVCSPMARTLEDLEYFWKAVVKMEPWKYDHTCLEMPWKDIDLSQKKLKWGVMWDDGVVTPSPACDRALRVVVEALEKDGQAVVSINPPSPYDALKLGSQLLLADAAKTVTKPIRPGESNDPGVAELRKLFILPRWIQRLYVWYIRHIQRDEIYAGLVESLTEKSITEYWSLVAQREQYRKKWFDMWNKEDLDFVLTVPNAHPAVPHGGMKEGFKACGYTFLFNILDYSAGVLPVTYVDAALDKLPASFKPKNKIEAGAYKMYDASKMHGLPVGVQVIGRRLEEEKVMEGMKFVQDLLRGEGKAYTLLPVQTV